MNIRVLQPNVVIANGLPIVNDQKLVKDVGQQLVVANVPVLAALPMQDVVAAVPAMHVDAVVKQPEVLKPVVLRFAKLAIVSMAIAKVGIAKWPVVKGAVVAVPVVP
jgi:hypothetical protein